MRFWMRILKNRSGGTVPALIASLCFVAALFSCESGKKTPPATKETSDTVSIAVPQKKNNTYFFSISNDAMALAEMGTPSSIRMLFSKLHRPLKESYGEREKVLLEICSSIMEIVWPSEKFASDVPVSDSYNPYIPIINSAQFGLYDTSPGDEDFFTLLLPNLVLINGEAKEDYSEQIRSSLRKCLEIRSDSVVANYLMGLFYLKKGKPVNALKYLKLAGKNLDTEPLEITVAKMRSYFESNNYQKTLQYAQKILSVKPEDKLSLELSCRSLVKTQKWDEAMDYSVKILQIDPENLDYILLRARILVAKGEYLKASALLDSCEGIGSRHRDYLVLRGWLQKNWSKNLSAVSDTMTTALSLYPNDLEVLLLSAQVASALESKIGGMTALELVGPVLESEPENMDALELYVKEQLRAGKYAESYDTSVSVIGAGGASLETLCCYVESCIGLAKNDEAWEAAAKLYAQNPSSERVVQVYIKSMIAAEKKKEAGEIIETLIKTSSSSMKSFLYYEKSLLESDTDAELESLRVSLSYNARNVDTLYRMYRIYYSTQNYKMAQFYLKQVSAIRPNDRDVQVRLAELEKLAGK